jgi:hypothetical protein
VGLHGAPDLELVNQLAFSAETVLTFRVFLLTPRLEDHGLLDSRAFGWTYLYVFLVLLHRQSLSREVSGKAMCDLAGRSVGWREGQMWRVAVRGGRVCASVYGERC